MPRVTFNGKLAAVGLLVIAALALAGVSLASGGHGHGNGKGQGKGDDRQSSPSSAQYQYSSGGKQYGHHKVAVCHKGHRTLWLPQPAVRAHLRHGDKPGVC
jgi:hypothetical protein